MLWKQVYPSPARTSAIMGIDLGVLQSLPNSQFQKKPCCGLLLSYCGGPVISTVECKAVSSLRQLCTCQELSKSAFRSEFGLAVAEILA
jgi:hypothetical protein